MTGNRSQLINFVSKFTGTVRFGNDQIAKIMGYGDYQLRNITISWLYYVEGLGHNLVSIEQFCDSDLEVAFCKHTCHIRDLDGVDLLKGSKGSNLYILYLENMMYTSPICLLSKKQLRQKPDLSYIHVFGALCYPTNDSEDLGKLQPKADIGILVDYAPAKKALGLGAQLLTPTTHTSGLVPNPPSPTPSVPPTKKDWEILFQLMFDEYFSPPTSFASLVPTVVAPVLADSTGTPSYTLVDQDAPSLSTSQTPQETQALVLPSGVEEENHDI
ncbi:hypothetical protein Tco_0034371 [Tanacetum coccineum]